MTNRKLLLVLGMHRSGTSAVTGMLADLGVDLGPARVKQNAFNLRGNREILRLRRLNERILERAGGSWCEPPDAVEITEDDRAERDAVLTEFTGEVIAVKEPRTLLAMELWRGLEPSRIGVIRNPVAVRESLGRRAAEGMGPVLPPARWEALWRHYNRALLTEAERARLPVIDFDRAEELAAQARAALEACGVTPHGDPTFFDAALVSGAGESWRADADAESIELWERLQRVAAPGPA
ncbi:MAG: hypothetical protein ACR2G3_03730 [Solirubrobacterales bacterium]